MSRDETIDDVLRAFAGDLEQQPVDQEDLDRAYSEAIAKGLVTETVLERSFEEFLNRRIEREPGTGEVRLVPYPPPGTVGAFVKTSRTTCGLTQAEMANDLQLRLEDLRAVEACAVAFDPERLSEAARALAGAVPALTPARAQRLLQQLRVRSGLQGATGPLLKAARRPPGK